MFGRKSPEKVVTRFAPSPTGFMHVGGVRTALFAYLFARKHKGTFILRIEDTDRERLVPGATEHIMKTLHWAGISWDIGPDTPAAENPFGSVIQSERLSIYHEYAQKLIEKGLAYPDPYTQAELEAFREDAKREHRPFLYRDHRPKTFETWDGTKPLRLKVENPRRMEWYDEVRGELEAGPEVVDDIILIKADGFPTYNFAHIVDDHQMGVTHIMRADEFIASTPKFLTIYEALDIVPPKFVTLPPILRADRKKKMGKRDGAQDALDYRSEGYLAAAVVNFLALTGWNPGTDQEIFTMDELIETFALDGIQSGGAMLNEEKLEWMNREHMLKLSPQEYRAFVHAFIPERLLKLPQWSEERFDALLPSVRERISTAGEFRDHAEEGEYDYCFAPIILDPTLLKWKKDESAIDALPRLRYCAEILAALPENVDRETVEATIMPYAEEVGRGEVLWPLRVALSGRERSVDPFTLIALLGTAEAYKRVLYASDMLRK
ncbi:glutamate--tRNA ligase [Candidatus Kaiserbacteria bacterium RIFCSPHIGHO2_02_FULL_50_50]|uniref:Glutamate--tRNA ligase n=1 Tax=Candidatus Kaiserbacteria bacterium RIFCSPHIGHO2_02_FULL_50_50 TaxID=1798492 RepID=A0A1F6DCW1_9BACT|nr:MAG: glutamate--tRNA ligase [Candidatus Kaiserbacteria bacterium RIFCSPHIGHO2_02_FULL_50_50]OGG88786.1 MAG: glutamate--tRNA ligase [Candidatus Kaiserbacteria bacterium RIFCSPLOWO2_12_FULL_50_10]